MSFSNPTYGNYEPTLSTLLTTAQLTMGKQYTYTGVVGKVYTACSCEQGVTPACSDSPNWPPVWTTPAGDDQPPQADACPYSSAGDITPTSGTGCSTGCVWDHLYMNGCPDCNEGESAHGSMCYAFGEQLCNGVDDVQTCTLGTLGAGSCATGYNDCWSVIGQQKAQGTILCGYNFAYDKFTTVGNGMNLITWLTGLMKGTNQSAPQGLVQDYYTRSRDMNLIYASVYDFYNQLYYTGPYAGNQQPNPFQQYNYISQNFSNYITNFLNWLSPATTLFESQSTLTTLQIDQLPNLLKLPTATQNGDIFTLTIYVSSSQYEEYKNSTNSIGVVSNFINAMLRDNQGTVQTNQRKYAPNPPTFENDTVDSVYVIDVVNGLYDIQIVQPQNFPSSTVYPNDFFGIASITVTVTQWSPMLVIYFISQIPNISFSQNVRNQIVANTGLLPTISYLADQNDIVTWKANIINYCGSYYTPPPYIQLAINYFLGLNNSDCLCYNSKLVPSNMQNGGNQTAMCFDNNCSTDMKELFNLTDRVCGGNCSILKTWLNSQDPASQPQNEESLNTAYAEQTCGELNDAYIPAEYNSKVLVLGIITTVLMGLLAFSVCKHMNYTLGKTIAVIVGVSIVMLSITGFLTRDLAGVSNHCAGGVFACKSRITDITIPNEFCTYIVNCECEFDQDCSSGCICSSGNCLPKVGVRPSGVIYKRRTNYILLITAVIVLIILPMTLIYLHEDYHWPLDIYSFGSIVSLLAIIPFSYILYLSLKKYPETIFTAPCQS